MLTVVLQQLPCEILRATDTRTHVHTQKPEEQVLPSSLRFWDCLLNLKASKILLKQRAETVIAKITPETEFLIRCSEGPA